MVELLYERSEGNAFLTEEIVAAMQAGEGPEELPVTLRDVLLARRGACRRRLQQLGPTRR